jgi:hypothetical protein
MPHFITVESELGCHEQVEESSNGPWRTFNVITRNRRALPESTMLYLDVYIKDYVQR